MSRESDHHDGKTPQRSIKGAKEKTPKNRGRAEQEDRDADIAEQKASVLSAPPARPDMRQFRATSERLRQSHDFESLSAKPVLNWRMSARRVCLPEASAQDMAQAGADIEMLVETLCQSRTGRALYEFAASRGVEIFYDRQSAYPHYHQAARIITINPHYTLEDSLLALARMLRRVWQSHEQKNTNPLAYEPDHAILLNRVQSADALAVAVRIGWELSMSGLPEVWNHLLAGADADIARLYEVQARSDFRSLGDGRAARAAYDGYFHSGRIKASDKKLIHEMLLDEQGYVFGKSGQRPARLDLRQIMGYGAIPQCEKNYLNIVGARPLMEGFYSDVRDRSNANFLWFIKFERSFQEKERDMVDLSVRQSAEIIDFAQKAAQLRQQRAQLRT